MTKYLFAALAGAAALASPAFAQDGERTPYDGVYIGGSYGYAFQPNDPGERLLVSRNGTTFGTIPTATGANAFGPGYCNGRATSTANTACANDRDGVEFMGRLGADTHLYGLVVGIVGEFGRSKVSDSVSAFSTTPAAYTLTRDLRYNGSVRGRLGFTPNRSTLFYGTGGVAYGRLRNNFTTTNTANSFSVSGKRNHIGYVVGGGVEQAVGNNFSVGLEYLYTSLRDRNTRVLVGAGTAPATNPFILGGGTSVFARDNNEFNWHALRFTAAFRF